MTSLLDEHRAYLDRNHGRGRIPGRQRFRIRHGILATPWFGYLTLSVAELEELAEATPRRLLDVVSSGHQFLVHSMLDGGAGRKPQDHESRSFNE